jgi:hypothetical protein
LTLPEQTCFTHASFPKTHTQTAHSLDQLDANHPAKGHLDEALARRRPWSEPENVHEIDFPAICGERKQRPESNR